MRYFVIRGFRKKKDSSGTEYDFELIDRELIGPALAICDFEGGTTGQIEESGSIHEDMFRLIVEADVVICDLSVHNANVFYELGVRHALRRKHTILIKAEGSADKTPFDIGNFRYLGYDPNTPAGAVESLARAVRASVLSDRECDGPVFANLPRLVEASADAVVPVDFVQEVQRAFKAGDEGWLAMLAQDLKGLRFERGGLREVARAQFRLQDWDRAQRSWEALRRADAKDIEALFKLANIYERQFRRLSRRELLEQSDQILQAVLEQKPLKPGDRAEAVSQQARNLKTRWRQQFDAEKTVQARRALACDRLLLDCYDRYREAFFHDLNNFYSGLAALQAGQILRSLRCEPQWGDLFDNDSERTSREQKLDEDLPRLTQVIGVSIERSLSLESSTEDEKMWARISKADLRFLTDDDAMLTANPRGLIGAYRRAVSESGTFYWGAVTGQLKLFASLGIRAGPAAAAVEALKDVPQPMRRRLLVVCCGHVIDTVAQREQGDKPRLPASAEARALELLCDRLNSCLSADVELQVLASGAPGTDILVHEVCRELKIPSLLCLPFPADDVVRVAYGGLDSWRNRFIEIVHQQGNQIRQLQSDAELPRWLAQRSQDQRAIDTWDRGNRWMMAMAGSWPADDRLLIALWDGDESHGQKGGTTQCVQLARETAAFRIDVIDSRMLLG
jgi:hypothetical protein